MKILGLYPQGPNTAACLLIDGELVAFAEEERFTRIKLATDTIPVQSASYCLKAGGITLGEVDAITVGWDNNRYPDPMTEFYKTNMAHPEKDEYSREYELLSIHSKSPVMLGKRIEIAFRRKGHLGEFPPILYRRHHACHAYSVFYPSPFDKALILVVDGNGEEMATSLWMGDGEDISFIRSVDVPDSLGFFYAAMTEYLGFSANTGEGKVMGLAPYGKPDMELRKKLDQVIKETNDGYNIDMSYLYYSKRSQSFRHTDRLSDLLGQKPRVAESEFTQWHRNLAWETQNKLESIVERMVTLEIERTGVRDVCVSGGVAMNCKMNGKLSELAVVDRLFVFPASNDAGCAYGSAMFECKTSGVAQLREKAQKFTVYIGSASSESEVEAAAKEAKIIRGRKKLTDDEIFEYTASRLADGALVGWFQGRMELGARALGNRSILADPSVAEMKERVNTEVKRREAFRPFAPAILEEYAEEFFDPCGSETVLPYYSWMLKSAQVKQGAKERIPAVVHVDGSIRPQVVSAKTNERFHRLLTQFNNITGTPCLLNTSFNVRGEPIVMTPMDAIRCFYSTGLDILVIGNHVFEK